MLDKNKPDAIAAPDNFSRQMSAPLAPGAKPALPVSNTVHAIAESLSKMDISRS
jgi:hypothetical protein